MTPADVAAKMTEKKAWLPGKRIKFDFGSQGTILADGVGETVTQDDGAADTTLKIDWADFEAMDRGELDGMTAFMTGKLKIEGDMSNAMQLQGVMARLRG